MRRARWSGSGIVRQMAGQVGRGFWLSGRLRALGYTSRHSRLPTGPATVCAAGLGFRVPSSTILTAWRSCRWPSAFRATMPKARTCRRRRSAPRPGVCRSCRLWAPCRLCFWSGARQSVGTWGKPTCPPPWRIGADRRGEASFPCRIRRGGIRDGFGVIHGSRRTSCRFCGGGCKR